jgi:hypothetical protein
MFNKLGVFSAKLVNLTKTQKSESDKEDIDGAYTLKLVYQVM